MLSQLPPESGPIHYYVVEVSSDRIRPKILENVIINENITTHKMELPEPYVKKLIQSKCPHTNGPTKESYCGTAEQQLDICVQQGAAMN